MDIKPIYASLRKHRIPAILIVLEIALACAVFCNAVFMIGQRVADLHMPNAIDQMGVVDISVIGNDPDEVNADVPRNLAALRRIPGVIEAAASTTVPFGSGLWTDGVSTKSQSQGEAVRVGASRYMFTRGGPKAFGLKLLEGRFFNDSEYATASMEDTRMPGAPVVIVTRALARHLWPNADAIGQRLWLAGSHPYTVVGVIANVVRPGHARGLRDAAYYATFFPSGPDAALTDYIVRTTPENIDKVLRISTDTLQRLSPGAVVNGQTFSDIRHSAFAGTRSMVWILVLVCVVMLAVTAFGIVGLSSFWVRQRRRQIGIRRALGATRGHIMQYFQTENFLLSSLGVVLGIILAFGINLYLMQHYQLSRMPWYYLPISAIALWLLGQLAVLGPALRASHVPPVVATRSV